MPRTARRLVAVLAAVVVGTYCGRGTVGHVHGSPLGVRRQLFCRIVVRVSFTQEARPFSGTAIATWREYGVADVLDAGEDLSEWKSKFYGEDAAAEAIFGFFWGESDILRTVRLRGAMRDSRSYVVSKPTQSYATTVSKPPPRYTLIIQREGSDDFSITCEPTERFAEEGGATDDDVVQDAKRAKSTERVRKFRAKRKAERQAGIDRCNNFRHAWVFESARPRQESSMPEHTAGVNDVVKMFYTGKQARAEGQPPEAAGTYVGHVVAGRAEPGHVKVQWTGYEAAEGLEACNYKESRPVALLQVLQKGDPDGRYKKPVDYVYVMEEAAHERAISRSERRASSRGRERTAPHWVHEVPLHRLGSCSTRDRIIVNRGFSLPELSEEPRPMSDALKGEQGTMDGLAIIGTAAAGRAKRLGEGPMRPLDGSGGSAHTVYNEGGPLVVLEDGSRERICSRPDIGLALLGDGDTAWVDENMAVFNSKEFKEARLRNSESSPVRYIEPSAPLPAILKLQRAAIEQNGAQKKKKIHLSICGGALDAGKEAARRDPLHHKSITYEAKETCRIFQTVRDKLRGETGKHIVKDVVFGDKGEFHELDIGDGEGKTLHEGCGWAEALEMIKCDLDEARGDLRRKDVFIYVDASPPCNGICFVNSGPGFADRRQEGIKLTKDIHEKLLEPLWKENAIDAYVLENTHDCIFEW